MQIHTGSACSNRAKLTAYNLGGEYIHIHKTNTYTHTQTNTHTHTHTHTHTGSACKNRAKTHDIQSGWEIYTHTHIHIHIQTRTQDRRAATVQKITAYNLGAGKLAAVNKDLRQAAVGDFQYCKAPLKLGMCLCMYVCMFTYAYMNYKDLRQAAVGDFQYCKAPLKLGLCLCMYVYVLLVYVCIQMCIYIQICGHMQPPCDEEKKSKRR